MVWNLSYFQIVWAIKSSNLSSRIYLHCLNLCHWLFVFLLINIWNSGHSAVLLDWRIPLVTLIKMMKEAVTKSIGIPIWQKGYHDHVVRNDADYLRIWDYICTICDMQNLSNYLLMC